MSSFLFGRISCLALITFIYVASPARAEIPRNLSAAMEPDQRVQGDLTDRDWCRSNGSYADVYRVGVAAGQTYQITMASDDFDTFLFIFDATGEIILATNDDGPGLGTHSRLSIEGPSNGVIYVVANSLSAEVFGAYILQIETITGGSDDESQLAEGGESSRLQLDQPTTGSLSGSDDRRDDNSYLDYYTIQLQAGVDYLITMRSDEIDAYLELWNMDIEQVGRNDDAPGMGRNAQLAFTPTQTAEYVIVANSFGAEETGAYEVSVQQAHVVATDLLREDTPLQSAMRAAPLPGGGTMHAIVLGLDYSHLSGGHLPQCDDDAIFIADTLRSRIPANQLNMQLLVNSEATISNLQQHLGEIARNVGPQDIVFLFYSGHGGQGQTDHQLSSEADRKQEYLCLYDGDFYDTMLEESLNTLNQNNHALTILALDSCYSGGFQQVVDRPGRMALFSSQEYLVSGIPTDRDEYNRLFGGHLTKLLCLALQGHADGAAVEVAGPADGRITVLEIEKYIRTQWRSIAIDEQYQEPQFHRPSVDPDTVVLATSTTTSSQQQVTETGLNLAYRQRAIESGGSFFTNDFVATAGQTYLFETSELRDGLDTIIQVRASTNADMASPDDPVIAENDDFNETRASHIEWTCPTSGNYYIAVSGYGESAGQFNLTLQELAGGNNQITENLSASLAISYSDLFISPGEPVHTTDFQLQAGQTYIFETHGLSQGCDTRIQLRRSTDPNSAQQNDPIVAEDDDGAEEALASRLIWTCDQTGAYYITSRSYEETTGSFSLSIAQTGAAEMFYEQQSIEAGQHFYSTDFVAHAGHTYLIETSDLVGGLDTLLQVRGSTNAESALPDDPVLAENDDFGGSRASRIVWTCPADGSYYLNVSGYGQTAGQFNLSLQDISGGSP